MSYAKQRHIAILEYRDCRKLAAFYIAQGDLETAYDYTERMATLAWLYNLQYIVALVNTVCFMHTVFFCSYLFSQVIPYTTIAQGISLSQMLPFKRSSMSTISTCHQRRVKAPRTDPMPVWHSYPAIVRKSKCNRYIRRWWQSGTTLPWSAARSQT